MELWIRSQDKKELVKTNDIYLVRENKYFHIYCYANNSEIDLGQYGDFEDKTRALEVLDEIQCHLVGSFLLKAKEKELEKIMPTAKKYFEDINNVSVITGDKNFDLVPINKDIFVYEMPKN